MALLQEIWTQADFEEYACQLQTLEESYGGIVPFETLQRFAAEIVNKKKGE